MRLAPLGIALFALSLSNAVAHAQVDKKEKLNRNDLILDAKAARREKAAATPYRTLTGKVGEIKAADQTFTIDLGASAEAKPKAKGKAAGQTWLVSLGNQTLLLRSGKNNQFSTIELADLKAGDTVQAVVTLQADPTDRSHTAWWLVLYPAGTMPPAR
jgi:hypothetical protein